MWFSREIRDRTDLYDAVIANLQMVEEFPMLEGKVGEILELDSANELIKYWMLKWVGWGIEEMRVKGGLEDILETLVEIMVDWNLGRVKMKFPSLQGRNNPKVYL